VIHFWGFAYARREGNGRPTADRLDICKAYILKMTVNIPTPKGLVLQLRFELLARRLCGSTPEAVPSESGFSVVFAEFARRGGASPVGSRNSSC